jgi:hypothetical protein
MEYDNLKDDFITGFAEQDDLKLFFCFGKLMNLVKEERISPEEVKELITLIGGEFTIWGKKYVLQ